MLKDSGYCMYHPLKDERNAAHAHAVLLCSVVLPRQRQEVVIFSVQKLCCL